MAPPVDVRSNPPTGRSGSLVQGPRGHACSICRRRKLKCGGEKPSCLQCVRGNRADDCVYEDHRQTPTHKFNARIAELQALVDSYERILAGGSDLAAPPASSSLPSSSNALGRDSTLHIQTNGGSDGRNGARYSAAGGQADSDPLRQSTWSPNVSRTSTSLYPGQLPSGGDFSGHAQAAYLSPDTASAPSLLQATFATMGGPLDGGMITGIQEEWDTEQLPSSIDERTLLTVFMGHRHQAHFEYCGDRLVRAMALPRDSPDRPHPCLINAVYLFASHFSRSATTAVYDALFLARARAGMQAAIQAEDRLLHVIQAGCLVSLYLYFKSRVLEGYQLGGAISRLAIACGLHQIQSPFLTGLKTSPTREEAAPLVVESPVGITLPEPKSLAELGDRMHTFWQVWCVDKYGIMSTGLACSLPDDPVTPMLKIKTFLPPRNQVFTKGMVGGADLLPLSSMYEEQRRPRSAPDSLTTLGYKGVELFCAALNLKNYKTSHPDYAEKYRRLDGAINRFASYIPPMSYREDADPNDPHGDSTVQPRMVWPHLLLLSARIALYGTRAHQDESLYDRRLVAAREAVGILRQIQHYDANYHEVAMAPCWKHVSETLLKHVKRLRAAGESASTISIFEREADASTQAMQRICHLFAATAMKCWDELA